MACMTVKITKKALSSILGSEIVDLNNFTNIAWSEAGMILSSGKSLFRRSLVVKIDWPTELAKHKTNRESLNKALLHLFAQVDKCYSDAVKAKASKEKEDAVKEVSKTGAPAKGK